MSYILDALKKAERERAIAKGPTLMSVHDTQSEIPRRRPWIIATVCLLGASALIAGTVFLMRQMGASTASSTADQSFAQPEQTRETGSAAKSEAPKAAVPSAESVAAETRTEAREMPAPASAFKRPGTDPEAAALPGQPPEPVFPIAKPSARQLPGTPIPAPSAIGTAAPDPTPPAAASLRDAISKMAITILMYSEDKSERMVFINDRKYMEGDSVDGHYLINSITQEGVILQYQGEKAILRPKSR